MAKSLDEAFGALEQDADIALFLYRPEYYGLTQDDMGNSTIGLAEVIVGKHRNGALGKVILRYVADHTRFESMPDVGMDTGVNTGMDDFAYWSSKIQ